jgi:hypothetical protein
MTTKSEDYVYPRRVAVLCLLALATIGLGRRGERSSGSCGDFFFLAETTDPHISVV